ncbi:iron-sulfur cluster assembly factor IBA57, mitochondrial-like [Glandiceps talaboti]
MSGIFRCIYNGALMRTVVRDCKGPFSIPKQNWVRSVLSAGLSTSTTTSSAISAKCTKLKSRTLLRISGKDSEDLLQGVVTNDVSLLKDEKAIYTMLLNQQGRVLYDAILYRRGPGGSSEPMYILECEEAIGAELQKHLKMYKIRKKVDVVDISSEYEAWALFGITGNNIPNPDKHVICVPDPRVPTFGHRIIVPNDTKVAGMMSGLSEVSLDEYDTHRYVHGVSEGTGDLPPGNTLPLEANLDYMNGVSFHKGCYLGQELTARTYHTGVIRKRLMPVTLVNYEDGSVIKPGETVSTPDGKNAGKFRNHVGINGIALLRMVHTKDTLKVPAKNGSVLDMKARVPEWWPHQSSGDVTKLHCS